MDISYWREARTRPRAGNLIDVFSSTGKRGNIVLADVCGRDARGRGHELYLRHAVRMLVDRHSPGSLLECLNLVIRRRSADFGDDCFASLFLAALQGACLTYASGGHDLALLMHANGRHHRLPLRGKMLGIEVAQRFRERSITVVSGDWLVLATDGVARVRNEQGVSFGASGIARSAVAAIKAGEDDPAACILDSARTHGCGGAVDEASVLCVRFS
jgi:serine phosphatase RsbU (regulator of sigma subunit)